MKNYIIYVNDHSGSMGWNGLNKAAMKDYNKNIEAVVSAANLEKMDTVVSVVGLGFSREGVRRQVMVSNPHVLHPKTKWECEGGTPLYDAIGNAVEMMQSLPDYSSEDVSFLMMITTDGRENQSRKYSKNSVKRLIDAVSQDGRWTFVCRVPTGSKCEMEGLGIPSGNIQEWDATAKGMEESTAIQTQAVTNYFASRSVGNKSSTSFYSTVENVDTSKLKDISSEVSLYVVPDTDRYTRTEIRDFILEHRQKYLKGAAFYQLVKTEARVGHKKMIVVRDSRTNKFYSGADARKMLNLPSDRNVRVNPGDHGNYDIFIQSESTNRLLPRGTGVVYWEKVGVEFTEEDLNRYQPKKDANGVIQLPKVQGRTTPTKSPVPVQHKQKEDLSTPMVDGKVVIPFNTREEARVFARQMRKSVKDVKSGAFKTAVNMTKRWFVFAQ